MNYREKQQGDVYLFQTNDNGNISIEDGLVAMSGGLETATYLSLFGGNEDDDGRRDNPMNWWANISEIDQSKQYHSETQHLLQSLIATSGNLKRVEDAAKRDLNWLLTNKIASTIEVFASVPGLNQLKLDINIKAEGVESSFEFIENWRANA